MALKSGQQNRLDFYAVSVKITNNILITLSLTDF